MFGLFKKKKTTGDLANEAQRDQSLDRLVQSVQRQANEIIRDIRDERRERERKMLREAFGHNGDS